MTSPENFGKQFEDIIGNNFSKNEENEITAKAVGEHIFSKIEGALGSYKEAVQKSANQRMGLFPEHMMDTDGDGRHVSYVSPLGWTHTWHGGQYIEHYHPKHGAVEVTNVQDKHGNLPIMAPEEFIKHAHEAENDFNSNYDPRDW